VIAKQFMSQTTRREFLKKTSAGVAAIAASDLVGVKSVAKAAEHGALQIPPHRALQLAGLHAYSDSPSVTAGQSISFHVSSTVPYRLWVCRLGVKVDDPAGDKVLHEFPLAQPTPQPIHPGSYVHVEKGLSRPTRALTLECWVRPWKTTGWNALLGQFDFQ